MPQTYSPGKESRRNVVLRMKSSRPPSPDTSSWKLKIPIQPWGKTLDNPTMYIYTRDWTQGLNPWHSTSSVACSLALTWPQLWIGQSSDMALGELSTDTRPPVSEGSIAPGLTLPLRLLQHYPSRICPVRHCCPESCSIYPQLRAF